MEYLKKMFILMIGFMVLGKSLQARVIEVWPGFYNITNQNILNSIQKLGLASFIKNDGKLILFPNEYNKIYVGLNLLNISSLPLEKSSKELISNIKEYEEKYNNNKDALDPVKWAFLILSKAFNNSKIIEEAGNFYVFKEMMNGAIGNAVDLTYESLKEGKLNKKEIIAKIIEYMAKDIYAKGWASIGVESLKQQLEENEGIQYLVEKIASLSIDFAFIALNSPIKINDAKDLIKFGKLAADGFWDGISFYLEIANGIYNVNLIVNTIDATLDANAKASIYLYAHNFIRDYVYKFHFNIDKMANFIQKNGYPKDFPYQEAKPKDFYQLFVLYGISAGYIYNDSSNYSILTNIVSSFFGISGYNIDINDKKHLKALEEMARTVLNWIKTYGDGGNYKIYLELNNNKLSVFKEEFNSLYWITPYSVYKNNNDYVHMILPSVDMMIKPAEIDTNITGLCDKSSTSSYCLFYSTKSLLCWFESDLINGGIYPICRDNPLLKVNPFEQYLKITNKEEKEYISTHLFAYDIKKSVQEKENLHIDIVKNINYRIVSYENNYKIEYTDIYIPTITMDPFYNKFIDMGVITPIDIAGNAKKLPISMSQLEKIFVRFSKVTSIFNSANIRKNIKDSSILWTTPIKRKQFFKFLVKLLNIDTKSYYQSYYLDSYSNVFKFNDCQNTTLEGCALKKKGIYHDVDSNKNLTLLDILVTLNNIEQIYKRTQK